jgi:hypothetical protein
MDQPQDEIPTKKLIPAIEEMFTYRPPQTSQLPKLTRLRDAAKVFAYAIMENAPQSADRTAAIRKLRECVMTANLAIMFDGVDTRV